MMTEMSKKQQKEDEWIRLTKEAVAAGAPIRANFRFKYKNKNLGSFLYRTKKNNNTQLIEKLKEVGFDYKKYHGNYLREKRHDEWISLLKEAIAEGVKIQVNHRFKYKGQNLGTFLVGAKENKKLVRKLKKAGLDYDDFVKDPELYAKRFIKDIWNSDKSKKPKFITRFYTYIMPKKDILKEETIEEINVVWKIRFGDRRIWRYPTTEEQRVVHWKRWRYDEEKNPEGKWLLTHRRMGNLFNFAYRRKRNIYLMKKIEKYFKPKEIEELKSEGFFDEKYLINHNNIN